MVRYSAGVLDWTKDDLRQMDPKTRKILTLCVSEEKGRWQGFDQCVGLCASGGGRPEHLCSWQRVVDVEGCR